MRLTIERAVVGERRSASQRAKSSRVAATIPRRRLRRADAGTPARRATLLRPARGSCRDPADASVAASRAPCSTSCVVPRGWLCHKRFDPAVLFLPFGHGRPPIAEHAIDLLGRSLSGRHLQNRADIARQRIGNGILRRRDREAEAAQVVVLVVVAVPAAVILRELEREPHAFRRLPAASRARTPPCAARCCGRGRCRCPRPSVRCRRWRIRSAR